MVRAGHTSERAIDMIYSVYGANLSVTQIIQRLNEDKKNRGHPALRTIASYYN